MVAAEIHSRRHRLPRAQLRPSRAAAGGGARSDALNDGPVAMEYRARRRRNGAGAGSMGLADLSALPRTGFKGTGTVEWLTAQGLTIGADSNRAYRAERRRIGGPAGADGDLSYRRSRRHRRADRPAQRRLGLEAEQPRTLIGYPMPRSRATPGSRLPARNRRPCSPRSAASISGRRTSPNGHIAQTSLAKMSGIVIRADLGRTPAYHVLADSASAEYLWGCLLDAMEEFDGAPVGLLALRQLAGGG